MIIKICIEVKAVEEKQARRSVIRLLKELQRKTNEQIGYEYEILTLKGRKKYKKKPTRV